MPRVSRTVVAVALVAALLASPGASAQDESFEFHQEAEVVEEIRGLTLKREVPRTFLTRAELRRRLERDARQNVDEVRLRGEERTLVAFGLAPQGVDLLEAATAFDAEAVDGYYDAEKKRLYLVEEDAELSVLTRSLFAHEITHALQDQYFDLEAIGDAMEDKNADEALAVVSLIEGDAQSVQYEYEHVTGIADAVEKAYEEDAPDEALLERTPPIIVESANFPYDAGVGLVEALFEEGGNAEVDAAFADPPRSTEQVIHPERYLERDEPIAVRLPDLSRALGGGWRELGADTLGEFGVIVLLTGPEDTEQAFEAALPKAAGWDGDRYALYARGDREVLLWRSVWDSAKDAREFAAALRAYDEERFGAEYAETDGALRLTAGDRAAAIERDGTTVSYALAPSPELADRALAVPSRDRMLPDRLPRTGGGALVGAR